MLNNRISRAALVGLIFTAVCAIAQPKDVDGWGGVKWGMSPEQVKTILAESYSVRQIKDPDDPSRLELIIDEMEISEGLKVQACLSTGKDSRIREVSIERAGKRGGNTPAERSGRGTMFQRFKELLIQKYGMPKSEDTKFDSPSDLQLRPNERGEEKRVLWVFPSTTINLYWSESAEWLPRYESRRLPGCLRVPSSSPSVSRRFGDLHGPGIALPCAQRVAQQFLNFLPLPQGQ